MSISSGPRDGYVGRNANSINAPYSSYNTTSNLTRIIKTPGGELLALHIKKRGTPPKCGDCHQKLSGVSDAIPCASETKERTGTRRRS